MTSPYCGHPFSPRLWLRPMFLAAALASSLAAANGYFVHHLASDLPAIASVLIANNGTGKVSQYTPIPGTVEPESYPYPLHGMTGVMGMYGLPQPGTNRLAYGVLFCTEDGTIEGLGVF